jgi:two-component system chemotaxis response regulator CheB
VRPLRIAVVDDSSFIRKAIARLLGNDARIEVVGTAASGEELLAHLEIWRPDVITLDLAMPGMGGLATLDRIMIERPTPVVILSTHSGEGAPQTIEALHRGAVDFIDKQRYSLVDFQALREVLLEKVLQVAPLPLGADEAAAEAPAGGGWRARLEERRRAGDGAWAPGRRGAEEAAAPAGERREADAGRRGFELLVVGASTGGPPAVQRVLEDLGAEVSVPIAVAQHMPEGFTRAFASRLNSHLPLSVREASDGEPLRPSAVYIAPSPWNLSIDRGEGGLRAVVGPARGDLGYRPSVDELFSSACSILGARVVAVLLTGMGRDGAAGMARLRQAGAYTVAQDEASSIVYGMPRAAVELRAAREVLPLERIGPRLKGLLAE